MQQEIDDLLKVIISLEQRVEALDRILAPVRALEDQIKMAIRRTYGGRPDKPIKPSIPGREARRPLFLRLLDIATEHGATKAERAELNSRLRAYRKRLDMLQSAVRNQRKRDEKKQSSHNVKSPNDQGELL